MHLHDRAGTLASDIISVAAVFKQFSTGISVLPVIIKNDTTRNGC